MRTVQMTLDDDLVEAVDQIVEQRRSALAREALAAAIENYRQRTLEGSTAADTGTIPRPLLPSAPSDPAIRITRRRALKPPTFLRTRWLAVRAL